MSEERKTDHIKLAFESQTSSLEIDDRFYYEPFLSGNRSSYEPLSTQFLGKKLLAPIWISSMTGGTEYAKKINSNLARACAEFKLGFGLGSCRSLLASDMHFDDFNMREICGDDVPFFANLGIAQLENFFLQKDYGPIIKMVHSLCADGLIIHINPLQEWFQPEGDRYDLSPLNIIKDLLKNVDFSVIVNEVGQGMGPLSLKSMLELPLAAIEFAAFGGTSFSKVEFFRLQDDFEKESKLPFAHLGHSAQEMLSFVNQYSSVAECKEIIISGGISSALDGFYFTEKSSLNCVYGIASRVLKYAMVDYSELKRFLEREIECLALAKSLLRVKK